mmetsp:Transcript_17141/g.49715  ORF Transcript_17141/g.49715 Transcript_17141/m.49715 type:complete len:224 (+) Transcript_17141:1764-2435(+)
MATRSFHDRSRTSAVQISITAIQPSGVSALKAAKAGRLATARTRIASASCAPDAGPRVMALATVRSSSAMAALPCTLAERSPRALDAARRTMGDSSAPSFTTSSRSVRSMSSASGARSTAAYTVPMMWHADTREVNQLDSAQRRTSMGAKWSLATCGVLCSTRAFTVLVAALRTRVSSVPQSASSGGIRIGSKPPMSFAKSSCCAMRQRISSGVSGFLTLSVM